MLQLPTSIMIEINLRKCFPKMIIVDEKSFKFVESKLFNLYNKTLTTRSEMIFSYYSQGMLEDIPRRKGKHQELFRSCQPCLPYYSPLGQPSLPHYRVLDFKENIGFYLFGRSLCIQKLETPQKHTRILPLSSSKHNTGQEMTNNMIGFMRA